MKRIFTITITADLNEGQTTKDVDFWIRHLCQRDLKAFSVISVIEGGRRPSTTEMVEAHLPHLKKGP